MEKNTIESDEEGIGKLLTEDVGLDFIDVSWIVTGETCNVSHFEISHKATTETKWQKQDSSSNSFRLNNLDEDTEYEIKVGVVYEDGSTVSCTKALIVRTATEKQHTNEGRLPLTDTDSHMNEQDDITLSSLSLTAKVASRKAGKPEALAVKPDEVHLRWDTPEDRDVTYYEIKYKSISDTAWKKPTFTDDESTSHHISHLSPQTEYQFKVRAHYQEEEVEGEFSDVSNAIKTQGISQIASSVLHPRQPGTPTVLDVGKDNVCIAWDKPEDEDVNYYEIKMKLSAEVAWLKIHLYTDNNTPYKKVSDLDPATEYEFKVRTHYLNGDEGMFSHKSDPVMTQSPSLLNMKTNSTSPAKIGAPRKAGMPAALDVGDDYLYLGWKKPEDRNVTYYEIKSKRVQDTTWSRGVFTKDDKPFYRMSGLIPSATYVFKVRANYGDEQEGDYSETSEHIETKSTLMDLEVAQSSCHMSEVDTSLNAIKPQQNKGRPSYELRYRASDDSPWCSMPILNKDGTPVRHWRRHKQKTEDEFLDEEFPFPDEYSTHRSKYGTLSLEDFQIRHPPQSSLPVLRGDTRISYRKKRRHQQDTEDEFLDEESHYLDEYSTPRSECGHPPLRTAPHSEDTHVEPSTKPDKPTFTEVGSDYIWLFWGKPQAEDVHFYEVRFKPKKQSSWNKMPVPTKDDTPKLLIGGLLQETEYVFKVRAHYENTEGEFSEPSDVIQTKQSPASNLQNVCIKLQDGAPSFYKLPLHEHQQARNEKFKTRKCEFGSSSILLEKTIMMIGATGSGKSTLIDGMVNHLLGVKWEDNFRFKIIDITTEEEARKGIETVSQTDWITSYRIHPVNKTVQFILNIIDTPGFGDTRGIERDQKLVDQIRAFFTTKEPKGIETIDVVCFVTQAPLARMTCTQRYIFDAILSIFGKDMADNIVAMVTFADGKEPPVLNALSAAKVPYARHFVFNNSALFEPNTEEECNRFGKMFWEMGSTSYDAFFTYMPHMKTQSLQLTSQVLQKREEMTATIAGLQPQIDVGLGDLAIMRAERDIVNKFEREIHDNKNFTYLSKEYHQTKVPLNPGKYVTNCIFCHVTCHYPCYIPDDKDKRACAAMIGGVCRVCPKKCPWDMHRNNDYRIEVNQVDVLKTYEEMKAKYELATKEKVSKETLLQAMKNKFLSMKDKVCGMLKFVRECGNYLRRNAIKVDPLTEVEYIDLMIQGETQEKKPGFKDRVKMLNMIRKHTVLIAKAIRIDDPDELLREIGFEDL